MGRQLNVPYRERVVEHRVDIEERVTSDGPADIVFKVRFWVEADPLFGGIHDARTARYAARQAVERLSARSWFDLRALVSTLLDVMPSANSVEALDVTNGFGVTIHRDWP